VATFLQQVLERATPSRSTRKQSGTGEKELYNLDADPLKLNNLVRRPAFDARQGARARRRDELKHCAGRECSSAGHSSSRCSRGPTLRALPAEGRKD
jgi:hypothetical protein